MELTNKQLVELILERSRPCALRNYKNLDEWSDKQIVQDMQHVFEQNIYPHLVDTVGICIRETLIDIARKSLAQSGGVVTAPDTCDKPN